MTDIKLYHEVVKELDTKMYPETAMVALSQLKDGALEECGTGEVFTCWVDKELSCSKFIPLWAYSGGLWPNKVDSIYKQVDGTNASEWLNRTLSKRLRYGSEKSTILRVGLPSRSWCLGYALIKNRGEHRLEWTSRWHYPRTECHKSIWNDQRKWQNQVYENKWIIKWMSAHLMVGRWSCSRERDVI